MENNTFPLSEINKEAVKLFELFGYEVHIYEPRKGRNTTCYSVLKDGQKVYFFSCLSSLTPEQAVKELNQREFRRGFEAGQTKLKQDLKNLLS